MTYIGAGVPVLRTFDVDRTLAFYMDWLGLALMWRDGTEEDPVYMRLSRDRIVLHLCSHHGDGTPARRPLLKQPT